MAAAPVETKLTFPRKEERLQKIDEKHMEGWVDEITHNLLNCKHEGNTMGIVFNDRCMPNALQELELKRMLEEAGYTCHYYFRGGKRNKERVLHIDL